MFSSTKNVIFATCAAAGLLGLVHLLTASAEEKLTAAERECEASVAPAAKSARNVQEWIELSKPCKSFELLYDQHRPPYEEMSDLQKRVVLRSRDADEVRRRSTWGYLAAVALISLTWIPLLWRFLLARIRELGDALRGR